jgi:hypothetical protein
MARILPRLLIGLSCCVGALPVAAQDNPWRVPGAGGNGGWYSDSYSYAGQPTAQAYGGMAYGGQPYGGDSAAGQGYGQSTRPAPQRGGPSSWETQSINPRAADRGAYAALPPENRVSPYGTAGRTLNDSGYGYGYAPAPNLEENQRRLRQDNARLGTFPSDSMRGSVEGYSAPARPQPQVQYGEFPPLEGEQRLPSAESLPPSYVRPAPAMPPVSQPAPGYDRGYDRSYERGYASAVPNPYAYRDPVMAGPSTLGNPWGYGAGWGGYGYGSSTYAPYGGGVPGPYGSW